MSTEELIRDLARQLMLMVPDSERFPIKIPLITGSQGHDPTDVMMVFQKDDGVIAVFYFSWDSSWDQVQNGYRKKEYGDLKALFLENPYYIERIWKFSDVKEKKEEVCESLPGTKNVSSWRSLWGLLPTGIFGGL